MAGRGTFVSIVLAFALILVSVSVCTCLGGAYSKTVVLTDNDKIRVNKTLQEMVDNMNGIIEPDEEYRAGRLFTKYIKLEDKEEKYVVIRLTRWSRECSVSMSARETSKGQDLLDAWKQLLPTMQSYLNNGSQWVAVSNQKDWIDYFYFIKDAPPPSPDTYIYNIPRRGTDCIIRPYMLLSHPASIPLNQLDPLDDDYLKSHDGKYKLTIADDSCVLKLTDQDDKTVWQNSCNLPVQDNCFLAFRSDGTLEMWNSNMRIWHTDSACTSQTNCAGSASLAIVDGHVKLYKSLRKGLIEYWSTEHWPSRC